MILVPTLRCNLSCSYCQVSRADENAKGYDWSIETLEQVITFLDKLPGDAIKVEFQGGEPLLRIDLLERIRSFCRQRFKRSEYVVCTNLQSLGAKEWEFLEASDTPPPVPLITLPGNSNKFAEIVKQVQRALIAYGYYSGKIDGVVGVDTRVSIGRLQQDYGLPVTGTVTPELLNSLRIVAQ